MEINQIYNEDCLEFLSKIEDKSIDLIRTDPPYEHEIHGGLVKDNYFERKLTRDRHINFISNGFDYDKVFSEFDRICKIPNMIPEWMEGTDENGETMLKYNGLWTNSTQNIPELISTYMKVWLEDSVPQELFDGMEETKGKYTEENQVNKIQEVYSSLVQSRVEEFKNIIGSLNTEPTTK